MTATDLQRVSRCMSETITTGPRLLRDDNRKSRTQFTFSPRSSSLSDRRISDVSAFIRSHSWKATITYGVRSSGGTLDMISCMLNGSGRAPTISSRIDLICTFATRSVNDVNLPRSCSPSLELRLLSTSFSVHSTVVGRGPMKRSSVRPSICSVCQPVCQSQSKKFNEARIAVLLRSPQRRRRHTEIYSGKRLTKRNVLRR